MSVIKTYGRDGEKNGTVIPLWHVDKGPQIDQVYLTTILPGKSKGPHLHLKRRGLFCCIQGLAIIIIRTNVESVGINPRVWDLRRIDDDYTYFQTGIVPGGLAVEVPPGLPALIYNPRDKEALVLNMPSPPWREDDRDEHEVTDWDWRP